MVGTIKRRQRESVRARKLFMTKSANCFPWNMGRASGQERMSASLKTTSVSCMSANPWRSARNANEYNGTYHAIFFKLFPYAFFVGYELMKAHSAIYVFIHQVACIMSAVRKHIM